MNNTNTHNDNANEAALPERPWWTVRGPLLAALTVLSLALAAITAPTPLAKWVFGEPSMELASR